jgi:LysM repeat protein
MPSQHVVKRGETLWGIAKLHYGDPRKWPAIAAHNNLPDADRIFVGQILKLPPRSSVLANGGRTGQSPWNGTSSSTSRTSSTPDLIDVLGLNPDLAVCTPDDLYYKSTLPQRSYGATTTSSEPVLMQRGMNSAIDLSRPLCTVKFSADESILLGSVPVMVPGYAGQVEISLFGEATVSTDGIAKCTLDESGVKAEASAVVRDGLREVFSVDSSLAVTASGPTLKLSVTFKGANAGQDVTYECEFKGDQFGRLTFEANAQEVEFRHGHSRITGRIGLRVAIIGVPYRRLLDAAQKAAIVVAVAVVVVAGAKVIVAVAAAAAAAATAKAGVAFASALIAVGLSRLLNSDQQTTL